MSAADPSPVIVLSKEPGYFRVVTRPPGALPANLHRPTTYTAYCLASDAARFLSKATGWAVIDETAKRSTTDNNSGGPRD